MTVISKGMLAKKGGSLIGGTRCDEEVIEIQPTRLVPGKRYRGAVMCMGVIAALLLLMGVLTAMQIYEQVWNDVQRHNRYQGFCSIPLSRDIQMLEQRKAPIRWRLTDNAGRVEPEVQVISLLEEDPEHILDLLREVLDIDIDDAVEKISVFNNGQPISFIHDFESNITGIVDEERCFTMELDPAVVARPEVFVYGLQHGSDFDVSRVHSQLRAVLPAVTSGAVTSGAVTSPAVTSRALAQRCAAKPVYALQKEDKPNIRKRSADAPPHDYMQFAGKSIQEISISNLAELLQYEQNNKLAA